MNKQERDDMKELKTDVKQILQDVAALKVKSGVWGAIGGMCVVVITLVTGFVHKGLK